MTTSRKAPSIVCSKCGKEVELPFTDDTQEYVKIDHIGGWEIFDGQTLCPKDAEEWLDA